MTMSAEKRGKTRVWVIEDHGAYRATLARAIDRAGDMQCDGVFGCCEDALEALAKGRRPDVVLLDLGLPGMSGLDGIAALLREAPEAKVVVVTVFQDDEKIFRAICEGASGYLVKGTRAEAIAAGIRELLAGGAPMTPAVARRVMEMFARMAPREPEQHLTGREREVLEQAVAGMTKKEIAEALGVSFHTVDTHLRSIYAKLHVTTRGAAVAAALRSGLIRRG